MNKTVKKTYNALKLTFIIIACGGWLVLVFIYLAVSGVYLLIT